MRSDPSWGQAIVRQVRDITPDIREITLAPETPAGPYATGAHLVVQVLVDGRQDTRRYSLVGEAPIDGAWRIAVKREMPGRGGSAYMRSLPVGARLNVGLPDTFFELSRGASFYLLIAGGIGVTPMRGMASALRHRGAAVRMLYGGPSRAAMAYLGELQAELGDRLAVFADDEGSPMDLAAAFAALPPDGEAYVCGPLGLLEAAKLAWAATGRPRAGLVFETFGATGHYAAAPFRVRVPRLGIEVSVPPNATMLDALRGAGVRVLHDCRRGECGLCAMDVLAVDGTTDHRDVFFSDHEHDANTKICVCVSRMASGTIDVEPAFRGDAPLSPGRRAVLV